MNDCQTGEAAAAGHGMICKSDSMGLAVMAKVKDPNKGLTLLFEQSTNGKALGAQTTLNLGLVILGSITCACGGVLSNVSNDLPTAADGAFSESGGTLGVDNPSSTTNLQDTELTIASKDVVLIVTHGLCVLNGATSTIMKKGVDLKSNAQPLLINIAQICVQTADTPSVDEPCLATNVQGIDVQKVSSGMVNIDRSDQAHCILSLIDNNSLSLGNTAKGSFPCVLSGHVNQNGTTCGDKLECPIGSSASNLSPPSDYSKSMSNVKGLTVKNLPHNSNVTRVVVMPNFISFACLGLDKSGGHIELSDVSGNFTNMVVGQCNLCGSADTHDVGSIAR